MQCRCPVLPQCEAAVSDKEIRFVEFAELDTEGIVLNQEGITAAGTVGRQQEGFRTQLDCLGMANLGKAQGFLFNGQTGEVERAIGQCREVIRALDGVVAEEQEFHHSTLLAAFHLD